MACEHTAVEKRNPESTCPLCGADNECAVARGQPAESCWCNKLAMRQDALDAVPESSRRKHCVCAACGKQIVRDCHDQ